MCVCTPRNIHYIIYLSTKWCKDWKGATINLDKYFFNILEQKKKIKNLRSNNNDYINGLNYFFEQYQTKYENLNKKSMDDETKHLYSSIELDKIIINLSPNLLYTALINLII